MSEAIGSAHVRFSASTGQFEKDVDKAQSRLAQFGKSAQQTSKELRKIRGDVQGLTAGATSFARLAQTAGQVAGASDQAQNALNHMTGSMYQAQTAVMALTAAKSLLAGPMGIVTLAAGAAAAAYGIYAAKQQAAAKAAAEMAEKAKAAAKAEEERVKGVDAYMATLRARLAGETELASALKGASDDELRRANELQGLIQRQERYRQIAAEISAEEDKRAAKEDVASMRRFKMILALERQVETMTMSREEIELYNMKLAGGSQLHEEEIRKLQEKRIAIEQEAQAREAARVQMQQNETFLYGTIKGLEDQQRLLALGNEQYLLRKMAASGASEGEQEHALFLMQSIEALRLKNAEAAEAHRMEIDRIRVEAQMRQQLAQTVIGTFATITSIGARESKKQFELHKKVSQAEALVSTAAGIMAVYKDPLTPWWSKLANAAAVAATGAAQIAAIRSTSFDGGGAITAPQDAGSSTASAPTTNVTLNLRGDEIFTGASIGRVFEQFNEYLKDGGSLNVQVN
jgi:hypothetical protein